MGMFLADLAFTVELIAISLGFYFLFLAKKEKSKELKIGANILLIGATLAILCTSFYSVRNWWHGNYQMGYMNHSMNSCKDVENCEHMGQ